MEIPTSPDTIDKAVSFSGHMRNAADAVWRAQHEHPFVRGIGDGTVKFESFRYYIRQDYLFLIEYGRFFGLASVRAPQLGDAAALALLSQEVFDVEMNLHRSFALEWGVEPAALESERMSPTTRAYTDFLIGTAETGDFAEIVGALLPCMWGYREIAERLVGEGAAADDRLKRWLNEYAGAEFGKSVEWCRALADSTAESVDDAGRKRMLTTFLQSSRHELAFWDACWRREQ